MRTFSLKPEDFVGPEFTTEFDKHLLKFSDIHMERLAPRTLKDRQEQIIQWEQILSAQNRADSLPHSFHEAVQVMLHASGLTKAEACRRAGISPPTLNRWLTGPELPDVSSVPAVESLARTLGFKVNSLTSRLPPRRRPRYSRHAKTGATLTAFCERVARNRKDTPGFALKPTDRIRKQWLEVIAFKTDTTREVATKHNSWRLKPLESTGSRVNWAMLFEGYVCVTAGVTWNAISNYLGYLKLPRPKGQGIPENEADTLAWLTFPDLIRQYLVWNRRRAGNIRHHGLVTFLQTILSFIAPLRGIVWNTPSLAESLPEGRFHVSSAEWQEHCARAHEKISTQLKALLNEGPPVRSRESHNRAAIILNSAHPLKELLRLPKALKENPPPPAHLRDYRAWLRDVVLVKLLVSNPLRANHFSVMTYRPDGTGNLYRTSTGEWRLRFQASDFKNEKGAANTDYDVAVERSVWPWIQRYLSEARPYAVDADLTDYFLLPFVRGPRAQDEGKTWTARKKTNYTTATALDEHNLQPSGNWLSDSIATRVCVLTKLYLPETNGFRPHTVRHIIATDHLKRHPRDYLTVAHLLHDKLDTVIKNYGHLTVDDGLRVLHSGVQEAMAELANV
jgi:transcriptional regulator with XRE-family HTH domain